MNLQQLNSSLPKPWLNINCNSLNVEAKVDSFAVDAVSVQSDTLLLNQNVAVAVPPANYSLLYADVSNRINVASQAQPTQQIAYLSDIPIIPGPFQDNNIISNDSTAEVKCENAGVIQGFINSNPVLDFNPNYLKLDQGQTALNMPAISDGLSQATTAYFGCNDGVITSAYAVTPDALIMSRDNILRMYLSGETTFKNAVDRECVRVYDYGVQLRGEGQPLATGLACAVNLDGDIFFSRVDPIFGNKEIFLTQGSNTRIWSPSTISEVDIDESYIKFKRSNVEKLAVDNTGVKVGASYYLPAVDGSNAQVLSTNGAGVCSWVNPPSSSLYGLFSQTSIKTVANTNVETSLIGTGTGSLTTSAGFFQDGYSFLYKSGGVFRDSANGQLIRFRLRNSGVLFDSGPLTLSNINTSRGWNIEAQFTYYGGAIITNFNFTYTDGNNNTSGFTNQGSNAINNLVPNTLDFTVQWTTANANNTITSNYGTLTKIF